VPIGITLFPGLASRTHRISEIGARIDLAKCVTVLLSLVEL